MSAGQHSLPFRQGVFATGSCADQAFGRAGKNKKYRILSWADRKLSSSDWPPGGSNKMAAAASYSEEYSGAGGSLVRPDKKVCRKSGGFVPE